MVEDFNNIESKLKYEFDLSDEEDNTENIDD